MDLDHFYRLLGFFKAAGLDEAQANHHAEETMARLNRSDQFNQLNGVAEIQHAVEVDITPGKVGERR